MSRPRDAQPARTVWIDAGAGVAGDMLLGALIEAGADLEVVRRDVEAVVPGAVRLHAEPVRRAGVVATAVTIEPAPTSPAHRSWASIRELLTSAELPERVRTNALAVFGRLATAEGRVHGVPAETVRFHEVGAWDSIADVVGVCAALDDLGIERVVLGPLAVGSGWVAAAHGRLPVPVPAVVAMLPGWTASSGGEGELATPTGVALVTTLAAEQSPLPPMRVESAGAGAGSRDVPDRPNVVRVLVGAPPASPDVTWEDLVVLEANVDDLDPRAWPSVLAALLDTGAADAWLTPILMKKGRPAHTVSALGAPGLVDALATVIATHTTSLGVRTYLVRRAALGREVATVALGDGSRVRVKVGLLRGRVVTATPEHDDCATVARTRHQPIRVVLDDAGAAARAVGLAPGSVWTASPPEGAPGSGA